ncbi:hypothetical protein MHYP_G00154970 [Metynnis hypsauchen]
MGKLGKRCFKPITRPAGRSPAGLPGRGRSAPLRSLARFPTKTAASVVGSLADGTQARVKCPRRESTIIHGPPSLLGDSRDDNDHYVGQRLATVVLL